MAGLSADEVVVGSNGAVYVAPVGTTGPSDIATALNAAFKNVGYLNEDGVEVTPGKDVADVNAWQSFYPLRKLITGRTLDFGMTFIQWNEETIKLAFDGGTIVKTTGPPVYYTFTPPSPETLYQRALVIQWLDGANTWRLHVPKIMVGDQDSFSLKRDEETGFGLTFSVLGTDGAVPFTLITTHTGIDEAT